MLVVDDDGHKEIVDSRLLDLVHEGELILVDRLEERDQIFEQLLVNLLHHLLVRLLHNILRLNVALDEHPLGLLLVFFAIVVPGSGLIILLSLVLVCLFIVLVITVAIKHFMLDLLNVSLAFSSKFKRCLGLAFLGTDGAYR